MNAYNHQVVWRDICNRNETYVHIPHDMDKSLGIQINILIELEKKIIILLALKRRRINSMVHLDRFLVRVLSHVSYTERRKIPVCTCRVKQMSCYSKYCFDDMFCTPQHLILSKDCHYHSSDNAREICLNCKSEY
jgi:hypothetical protein